MLKFVGFNKNQPLYASVTQIVWVLLKKQSYMISKHNEMSLCRTIMLSILWKKEKL